MNFDWRRIVRSPLLHFVLLGLLLFAFAGRYLSERRADGSDAVESRGVDGAGASGLDDGGDPSTVRVDRDALLGFIQSRTRMARIDDAARAWDGATAAVRKDWVDRYVREEALVREARSLGLADADELIRRRLVQQMEFLVEGTDAAAQAVSDAELEAAYRARRDGYRQPATYRFAHAFVRPFEGHESKAPARARVIRDHMNRDAIPFERGYPYGDRFPYDNAYVDRTADEIRSHFGAEFVAALDRLKPDATRWQGPIRSKHGLHLVMLTTKSPAREATLDEVRSELSEELLREKRDAAIEAGVAAIVAKYAVELDPALETQEP